MPAFPLYRVVQRIPRAYLMYPEREDCEKFLGIYIIEQLECGHSKTVYPGADLLIARYRRCRQCEEHIAVPKKPVMSVPLEKVRAAQTFG